MKVAALAFAGLLFTAGTSVAKEKLILDMDLDADMLTLADNIDNFIFERTMSFSNQVAGDLNRRMLVEPLRNHVVVSFVVRIDGEIAGAATEQETVGMNPDTGDPFARSSWLITLNHPKAKGVIAVAQEENAKPVFSLIQQVNENPGKDWPDAFQRFLSTSSAAHVDMATHGLERYRGAKFEEYNYVNPADLKQFGRFRGKIQIVIETAK